MVFCNNAGVVAVKHRPTLASGGACEMKKERPETATMEGEAFFPVEKGRRNKTKRDVDMT
jgi:hypothetical protein